MAGGVKPWVARTGAALLLFAVVAVLFLLLATRAVQRTVSPDPVAIAGASLAALREQNRLSAFAARFVAVVTARQGGAGASAERTIILPGTVRYEVDLARLSDGDVRWDAGAATLAVRLPPLQLIGPQIDLTQVRAYGGGEGDEGVLARLAEADQPIDLASRRAGQEELLRQAREAAPMRLARDATRRAVEQSFALPLRTAGIAGRVEVRFAEAPALDVPAPDVPAAVTVPAADVPDNRQ